MPKIKIDAVLYLDVSDTVTKDQIINGLRKLKNRFRAISAMEVSSIKVHQCNHDLGQPCTEEEVIL